MSIFKDLLAVSIHGQFFNDLLAVSIHGQFFNNIYGYNLFLGLLTDDFLIEG